MRIVPASLLLTALLIGGAATRPHSPHGARAPEQSGRAKAPKTESPNEPEAQTASQGRLHETSHLVLGLMKSEEFEACGLAKLSAEERDRLDRWMLHLLLTLSATTSGEILTRSSGERDGEDPARSQMGRELTDLRLRLAEIQQASAQLALDLSRVRLALGRRDLLGAESALFSAESSLTRIQRALP